MTRAWIGKSIIFIGAIHTVFGFVAFRATLAELAGEGLLKTVNGEPVREFAFWFIAFGLLAVLFGAFVDWSERERGKLPAFLGWSLLALAFLIVAIMPVSGGWTLLVPALGAIARGRG